MGCKKKREDTALHLKPTTVVFLVHILAWREEARQLQGETVIAKLIRKSLTNMEFLFCVSIPLIRTMKSIRPNICMKHFLKSCIRWEPLLPSGPTMENIITMAYTRRVISFTRQGPFAWVTILNTPH